MVVTAGYRLVIPSVFVLLSLKEISVKVRVKIFFLAVELIQLFSNLEYEDHPLSLRTVQQDHFFPCFPAILPVLTGEGVF